MGAYVTDGATIICPFGTSPATLRVTSQMKVKMNGKPVATIQDASFPINIPGFGMCTSLTNPAVASATAAALGVLTPQPCTFSSAGTWFPTQMKVTACGKPCLTSGAQIMCMTGFQQCSVTNTGQFKVVQ